MTEIEYQALLQQAKTLLASINNFPAHELNEYADIHHPEDKSLTSRVWAVYCEADPWPFES